MPVYRRVRSRAQRRLVGRVPLALASSLVLGAAFATSATADTPPPPQAAANCYGHLSKAPTTDEPNNLNYKFNCDHRITAYTLIVNRGRSDTETVDDFSTVALVVEPNGDVDPSASFNCEGTLPGPGMNCNAGGGHMSAWSYAEGSFDTTDPYCKSIPPGSPPGTRALPTALVQLVVTDTSGAQDGPFRLLLDSACPAVPDRVPFPARNSRAHRGAHHHHKGARR